MKKISIEHPFFEFMGSLGDWMILNVLFVVTCLPVITIGTSLTAIYQVSLRRIKPVCGKRVYPGVQARMEGQHEAVDDILMYGRDPAV